MFRPAVSLNERSHSLHLMVLMTEGYEGLLDKVEHLALREGFNPEDTWYGCALASGGGSPMEWLTSSTFRLPYTICSNRCEETSIED